MTDSLVLPCSARQILLERGRDIARTWTHPEGKEVGVHGGVWCCQQHQLEDEIDFQQQECWLEEVLHARGHECILLPKFHPELNFIERFWGRIKKKMRYHCDGHLGTLKTRLAWVLDDDDWTPLSLLRKYARICWRYMDAYRKGYTGPLAAYAVKKAKSHRMVSERLDREMASQTGLASFDAFLEEEVARRDAAAGLGLDAGDELWEEGEGGGEGGEAQ
jgi:hypothetical protein